jgi:hypothetical protein
MPAAARAQFQSGNRRGGRVRQKAWLADGLRGYLGGVQTGLAKARPQLSEQNSRPEKSDQRGDRRVDLEKVEVKIAVAHGSRRGGDLHGACGLSRRVRNCRNRGYETHSEKSETPYIVSYKLL